MFNHRVLSQVYSIVDRGSFEAMKGLRERLQRRHDDRDSFPM